MNWLFLFLAGLMEIGWPVGLKLGFSDQGTRWWPLLLAGFCMAASGLFLFLAQRTIPMGTAYAIWTGIGSVGAVAVGILAFQEPATAVRLGCFALIVSGIIGLKLSHSEKHAEPMAVPAHSLPQSAHEESTWSRQ